MSGMAVICSAAAAVLLLREGGEWDGSAAAVLLCCCCAAAAYVSTISLTKSITSTADAWLLSPRKSIKIGTTVLTASGNLVADLWMAVINIAR